METTDRKKINKGIITKIESFPVGVDWRIIRLKRQRDDNKKISRLDHKTKMVASM